MEQPTIVSSGRFRVRSGEADRFLGRWSELITWTREHFPEMGRATLSRSDEDPDVFLSFATWNSATRKAAWRASEDYQRRSRACRELCDEYLAGNYTQLLSFGEDAVGD